jgi:hypothetical protein
MMLRSREKLKKRSNARRNWPQKLSKRNRIKKTRLN